MRWVEGWLNTTAMCPVAAMSWINRRDWRRARYTVTSLPSSATRLPTARITLGRRPASREPTITETPAAILATRSDGRRGGVMGQPQAAKRRRVSASAAQNAATV